MITATKSAEGQEAAAAPEATPAAPVTPVAEGSGTAPGTKAAPVDDVGAGAAAPEAAPEAEAAAAVVASPAPAEVETPVEEKGFMHRTKASAARFVAMVAEVTTSKVAKTVAEMGTVTTKGLFADMVAHPSFWDLVDILFDVRWALKYQLWNLQYAGETDFTELEAAWAECLDEFKAAAVDSFNFWDINEGKDPEDAEAGEVSMSLEEAQQIEGTLKQLADLIDTAEAPEQAVELRGIGKSLLDIALKAGIDFTPEVPGVAVAIDVTKTKEFGEMATRATEAETKVKDLETKLSETADDLEVTKAGLAAAVEATGAALRQPLPVERPKN